MQGRQLKENPCNSYQNHVNALENTVKCLEDNLKEANRDDKQLIMNLNSEKVKYESLTSQLEEALKENRVLLEILQQKSGDQDVSRASSNSDLTSCSTMSIVHLQYKYEEVLASHHGLLKLLEMKGNEIKKVYAENETLKGEIEQLKSDFNNSMAKVEKLRGKVSKLKSRKNEKIVKLKQQKETLELVHNQLIDLLHNKCIERDSFLSTELKNCSDSEKALLIQEVRKNNLLIYENFQHNQEIEFLKSIVNVDKINNNKSNKNTS